jgi:hypothetical protein
LLTLPIELLDGLLPVLICAPPDSPSEEPRKIYYHADGARDNTKPADVSDNRRTTRSAGAAPSTSKVAVKKSPSIQPQKRPEIHMFSSKSRNAEDSEIEIIELPSSNHGTKSRAKKRPLPDGDEAIEVEEARGKRASLRTLYDSDSDEKTAVTKVKKSTTKKAETSAAGTVKKNDKRAAEAVRGKRGGRAGGRGAKGGRVVKSKTVITDSSSADSDPEVPASDPAEAPLAPRPRPKPKPAYKTASSVVAKTVEIPTSATTALQPPTDISTESSLTTASETSTYPNAPLTSQQVPVLQGARDIVSATSTYQEQGPLVNPIPSATSTQVVSSGPPQTLAATSAASAPNPIPSVTGTQVTSSGPLQTLTVASTASAPSVRLQGDFFEGGLLSAGEGPQAHTTWDPRLPYTDSAMQHNSRGYTGYRDPRFDHTGCERLHSRPPGEDGWDVAGRHVNYHNQDRRRGYEEVMWDGSRRDEYREVRRGGRDEAGWDVAGQEFREVRRMGRDEGGWAVGGRYNTRRLPEARQMGWEAPPREEFAHYGAIHDTADYGDPSPYCQGPATRLPSSTYPDDTTYDNGRDYLHPPPPPPPSRSSNDSTSPFGFQAELQQMIPNALAAQSTADNSI